LKEKCLPNRQRSFTKNDLVQKSVPSVGLRIGFHMRYELPGTSAAYTSWPMTMALR